MIGDIVRIVGVPDLSSMARQYRDESLPVFQYLVGRYKTVKEFDQHGLAWLYFTIPKGPYRGWHSVAMEPYLLKVRNSKRRTSIKVLKQTRQKRPAA